MICSKRAYLVLVVTGDFTRGPARETAMGAPCPCLGDTIAGEGFCTPCASCPCWRETVAFDGEFCTPCVTAGRRALWEVTRAFFASELTERCVYFWLVLYLTIGTTRAAELHPPSSSSSDSLLQRELRPEDESRSSMSSHGGCSRGGRGSTGSWSE